MEAAAQTVRLFRPGWRWLAAALVGISRGVLPWILWRVWTATDPPITPPLLAEMLLVVWALPGAAAWLIGRAFAVRARVTPDGLELLHAARTVPLPRDRIAGVRPWRVPLPDPGVTVALSDGRRLALAARDPSPLVAALAPALPRHPLLCWAAARPPAPTWRYYLGRYVLFALLPAGVLFNTHQQIAYGGFLGQYYLVGLRAWLGTAAIYWATIAAYLLLYASVWRAVAEAVTLAAAPLAPAYAGVVRRTAERVDQVAFYGGVPLLLALRYLA